MEDNLRNKVLITCLATCWAFMIWWWFFASGIIGAVVSLIVAAIVGGITWFVYDLLT